MDMHTVGKQNRCHLDVLGHERGVHAEQANRERLRHESRLRDMSKCWWHYISAQFTFILFVLKVTNKERNQHMTEIEKRGDKKHFEVIDMFGVQPRLHFCE